MWHPAMHVSESQVEVLARIVKGECDARISREGMVAVAAVVLNRVHSKSYPNTIAGVAHQPRQFSSYDPPRRQSHYYGPIPQRAWDAARAALAGEDPTFGATVFFNPEIVSSKHEIWRITAKMQFVKRIGEKVYDSHVFYRVRPNRVLAERHQQQPPRVAPPISSALPDHTTTSGLAGFRID
jgi:spore germination cell wall hydrolase CwlJ-like protein